MAYFEIYCGYNKKPVHLHYHGYCDQWEKIFSLKIQNIFGRNLIDDFLWVVDS